MGTAAIIVLSSAKAMEAVPLRFADYKFAFYSCFYSFLSLVSSRWIRNQKHDLTGRNMLKLLKYWKNKSG
jgi:hypothetical protein